MKNKTAQKLKLDKIRIANFHAIPSAKYFITKPVASWSCEPSFLVKCATDECSIPCAI